MRRHSQTIFACVDPKMDGVLLYHVLEELETIRMYSGVKTLKGTTEWLLIFYGDDPTLSEGFSVLRVLESNGARPQPCRND